MKCEAAYRCKLCLGLFHVRCMGHHGGVGSRALQAKVTCYLFSVQLELRKESKKRQRSLEPGGAGVQLDVEPGSNPAAQQGQGTGVHLPPEPGPHPEVRRDQGTGVQQEADDDGRAPRPPGQVPKRQRPLIVDVMDVCCLPKHTLIEDPMGVCDNVSLHAL